MDSIKIYTLRDVQDVIERIGRDAPEANKATAESKARKEHDTALRGHIRNLTAQAVARAWLISIGPKVMRALMAEKLPAVASKSTRISEAYRVLTEHDNAKVIAPAWAEEKFDPEDDGFAVSDMLKEVKPGPDYLGNVTKHVTAALAAGLSQDDILQAVAAACEVFTEAETEAAETEAVEAA